jgi:SAM-dependent MidA family methyltransferase
MLKQHLTQAIADHQGFLPFPAFMQAALYEPKHGYYQQQNRIFGAEGDFITGAEMGPWLALAFADLIHHHWQQLGSPKQWALLEQGGGRGRLLAQVLRLLRDHFQQLPSQVFAVEQSPLRQAEQAAHYREHQLDVSMVATLDAVQHEGALLVFSNELPDAFPVRCFVWQQGQAYERGVGVDAAGAFVWQTAPQPMQPQPAIDAAISAAWPEGYISEFNHGLDRWQGELAALIRKHGGVVMTVDYGYSQQEYYRPNRLEGTLMGHASHQTVYDVLTDPGASDITAHIDFTALARCGQDHGLHAVAYMTQGAWLACSPLVQATMQDCAATPNERTVALLAHAKRLMLPHAGMGETFKLLVQSWDALDLPPQLASMNRLERLNLG